MLAALVEAGLTRDTEVLGQAVARSARRSAGSGRRHRIALENARRVCQAARNAGTTVTLDMEDHTTTDSTLDVLAELRQDFPETGAVLQAYLRRTEADCKDLAHAGLAGAAVQGRLQGARVGGLPGPRRAWTGRTCAASRC